MNKMKPFMKMKQLFKITAIALVTLPFFLQSCSDDEVSQAHVQLDFNPVNTSQSISTGRVKANSLEFTDGSIKITEIQFEAETDTDSIEVNWQQNVVIDFATGQTTPDLSALTFPKGTYREVEVEIELLDENNEPSIVVNGTFTDSNNNTHPIRFEFNSGETFEVEKEGTITFGEGERVLAQVTFNPGAWFIEVSSAQLEAATKDSSGVIVISSTQNTTIYNTVADGLDVATEVEMSNL
jgi:hypothetical protein